MWPGISLCCFLCRSPTLAYHMAPSKQAQLVVFGHLHFLTKEKPLYNSHYNFYFNIFLLPQCENLPYKNTGRGCLAASLGGGPPTTLQRSLLLYNVQSSLWAWWTSTYPSLVMVYTFTILLLLACVAMDTPRTNSSWLSLLTLLFGICIEIVNVLVLCNS
jgi:hypothetical protein